MFNYPFPILNESRDQVLARPATWHGQPISTLLTSEERAAGCVVYEVERNAYAPHLLHGDLVVAHPLARDSWNSLTVGGHYVCVEQMGAGRSTLEPAFLAEHIIRVTALTKKRIEGAIDCGNGESEESGIIRRNLFGLYRISRTIRPTARAASASPKKKILDLDRNTRVTYTPGKQHINLYSEEGALRLQVSEVAAMFHLIQPHLTT